MGIGKGKNVFFAFLIIVAVFFSYYIIYSTRPLRLDEIIETRTKKEIQISVRLSPASSNHTLPSEIRINDERDIKGIISILEEYKYSKRLGYDSANTVRQTLPMG